MHIKASEYIFINYFFSVAVYDNVFNGEQMGWACSLVPHCVVIWRLFFFSWKKYFFSHACSSHSTDPDDSKEKNSFCFLPSFKADNGSLNMLDFNISINICFNNVNKSNIMALMPPIIPCLPIWGLRSLPSFPLTGKLNDHGGDYFFFFFIIYLYLYF